MIHTHYGSLHFVGHKPSCDDITITTYSDTILVILTQVEVSREPCLVDENGKNTCKPNEKLKGNLVYMHIYHGRQ